MVIERKGVIKNRTQVERCNNSHAKKRIHSSIPDGAGLKNTGSALCNKVMKQAHLKHASCNTAKVNDVQRITVYIIPGCQRLLMHDFRFRSSLYSLYSNLFATRALELWG